MIFEINTLVNIYRRLFEVKLYVSTLAHLLRAAGTPLLPGPLVGALPQFTLYRGMDDHAGPVRATVGDNRSLKPATVQVSLPGSGRAAGPRHGPRKAAG